jgi:hypothetical protein
MLCLFHHHSFSIDALCLQVLHKSIRMRDRDERILYCAKDSSSWETWRDCP